ncbi:hypothetical protein PAAG_09010 [Paracoccidioides lutzii Pb01]|uniref:Uncharacterized protein n=1 Tax=Paracoccidioides lutzii (strain ATCC MYA-826 / Pb01) TaxID=502779 RepID=C1HE17_PARBA|nr:hypothetical protein PAAG_09010 [Paracoccidioides lutzii Pb01]EEH40557.1 hypothetical protein PAAG_09010 [Paracoccidioides lutzii Pb01]
MAPFSPAGDLFSLTTQTSLPINQIFTAPPSRRGFPQISPRTSRQLQERPEFSMLRKWYTGNYEEIATYKRGNMEAGGFERILMKEFPPWFDWVKPLRRNIRRILFPHGAEGLIVGTPQDPKRLYDPTIKAYDDDAIALIGTEEV